MTADEIIKRLEAAGVDPCELDELVHEAKAAEAACINNCGLTEQVEYLVSALGADALADRLDDSSFSWRKGGDAAARAELAELEAEFERAGGRGVELADRIDELRAELGVDND